MTSRMSQPQLELVGIVGINKHEKRAYIYDYKQRGQVPKDTGTKLRGPGRSLYGHGIEIRKAPFHLVN